MPESQPQNIPSPESEQVTKEKVFEAIKEKGLADEATKKLITEWVEQREIQIKAESPDISGEKNIVEAFELDLDRVDFYLAAGEIIEAKELLTEIMDLCEIRITIADHVDFRERVNKLIDAIEAKL
jgi:hypothetical protein